MHPTDTISCFASHMGLWMVDPHWLTRAHQAVLAGVTAQVQQDETPRDEMRLYEVLEGLAIIDLCGPMTKAGSAKFGECSTVTVRHALRSAEQDDEVRNILLRITSPGGHVAGTQELAREVARVNEIKPITAQIEDMGASAAYWVASQCSRIVANEPAEVGSIGVFTVLYDTSEQFDREGVKVHVVSTGPQKGAGAPGTEITPETLAGVQEKVDDINGIFIRSIQEKRDIDPEMVATGETWLSARALSLGLIDEIQPTEETVAQLIEDNRNRETAQSSETARARFRVLQAQRRKAAIVQSVFS